MALSPAVTQRHVAAKSMRAKDPSARRDMGLWHATGVVRAAQGSSGAIRQRRPSASRSQPYGHVPWPGAAVTSIVWVAWRVTPWLVTLVMTT